MEERNVLSTEEVEALIKAAQTTSLGVDDIANDEAAEDTSTINTQALHTILDTTRSDFENKLTALLRKKSAITITPPVMTNFEELLKQADAKHAYSFLKIMPYDYPAMISTEFSFLDMVINLLYGGKITASTPEVTSVGKIGVITAEKICLMLMDSFVVASADHAKIKVESPKSSLVMKSANYFKDDESVHAITLSITVEEIETKLFLYLTDELLSTMLPVKAGKGRHRDSDFWKTAIKSEVIDSYVTITTTTNDIHIKVKDFMKLKEGDEITISDPTIVYVCMNNLKLFRALAGQSNSKIVAKIVGQV